jgi:hypothetical protein
MVHCIYHGFCSHDYAIMIPKVKGILRKKNSIVYSSLEDESEEHGESSSNLLNLETSQSSKRRVWPFVLPWIVSTVTFAWATGYFYLRSLPPAQLQDYSYSTGWKTDFGKSGCSTFTRLTTDGTVEHRPGKFRNCPRESTFYRWSYVF